MRRYRIGIFVIAMLFLAGLGAGLTAAKRFGSEQIISEVEERLGAALGTSVSVGRLRVRPGTFIRVDGEQLTAWPAGEAHTETLAEAYGLEVDRVSGSVDAVSLLGGRIELARLRIHGAHLRLAASGNRGWSPLGSGGIASQTASADAEESAVAIPGTRSGDVPQPLELLAPLIALETTIRRVMSAPHAAGVLEFRDVAISFEGGAETGRGALQIEDLHGRLVHYRFGGGSELRVNARLSEDGRDRGNIALTGRRRRDGAVRIVMNIDSVELAAGTRYVRGIRADASVDGTLSGLATYETPEPGTGRLEIDWVVRDLESSVPDETRLRVVSTPRIDISGMLEITPQSATLRDVRIANRDSSVRLSGEVARPLRGGSMASVDLGVRNLALGRARHLIGWLPEIERKEAAAVLAPLKRGRLASLHAVGSATLSGWQDLLAGRTRRMPRGFRMEAELADTVAWVADTNRIEDLSAKLSWVDTRVEITEANAVLNGRPLPELDLVIDGFPNLLAGDASLRAMDSTALPLVGLATLWQSLRPRADSVSADVGTHVGLEIESLNHPLFLWPMWDVSATIEARPHSVHIVAKRATWAGVPIRGKVNWFFQPEEHVSVRFVAERPSPDAAVPRSERDWARGEFEVGPILGGRWQQNGATGRFVASAGNVRIRDLEIDLAPAGSARADGSLELSIRDEVPFRVNFGLVGGDASALARLVGLAEHQVTGRLDADGSFEGQLKPGTSFFAELNGLLDLRGFDGEIRKVAPPVVAIAEATESIESFDPGDVVMFERVDTVLEFADGGMHSAAFTLDGPELGVVASGDLHLAIRDKTIDAQVFLFLFRKLDRMLGKIPILNRLLLGTDENLVAAAFEVNGRWSDPQVASIPLPSSAGPASQVLQGVPLFVMRGIRALGSLVRLDAPSALDAADEAQSGS